jgi:protein-export chaperone SecB
MPHKFVVQGGARLQGAVTVSGSKNAALPMMAAALLARGATVLRNVPDLTDVHLMAEILETLGCEAAFILELVYGAVVQINPQEPDHAQPLLLIEAPRTMFPFARNLIADITRDGGFPPLMLQPIDFVQMFRQRLELAAAQAQQNAQGEGQPN